jgi:hydroxymethylglutaryl-CoA lyase
MLEEMGIETGVNLEELIQCAQYAREIIKKDLPGHLIRAGRICWGGV